MSDETRVHQVGMWCIQMPAANLEYPFGPETAVYKVGGKIFALLATAGEDYVTLKAEPVDAVALRAQYESVREGYYMNKRHWITIDLGPEVPIDELKELVGISYDLVVFGLTRRSRTEIGQRSE